MDSVNAMFEINPFSSFSEFIDIEDFIVSHSRLEKYKKLYQSSRIDFNKPNKLGEQLYFYKVEEIRKELNLFSRFFNLAAVAAPNEYEAHKQMCVLMPETATIEEVVLILNPLYNNHLDSAVELLLRMGFHVLEQRAAVLDSKDIGELFKDKLN